MSRQSPRDPGIPQQYPTLAGSHLESMALACLQGGQVIWRASKAWLISLHSSCTSGTSPAGHETSLRLWDT